MPTGHHIRGFRWILAGVSLLCGVMLFVIVRKVGLLYLELQPPLMLPTKVLLWVGPSGWLAFMVFLSALLVFRDFGVRSRFLKPGITVALWVAATGAQVAVACLAVVIFFQPICVFTSTINR